ncbi:MAG: hypothetical protein ACI4D5_08745 [Kineothrix sp.]
MYRKVKQYALDNHFTVDEKKGWVYGKMNGFFIFIRQDGATLACHSVQIWVKEGSSVPIPEIADFVQQCPSKYQYLQTASYNGSKIIAQFQGLGFQWEKNYVPCLDQFLKDVTAYCSSNGLVTCCESCGSKDYLTLLQLPDGDHMLCSSCQSDASEDIWQTAGQNARTGTSNIAGGIVGALLGSLLGAAAWVLIYQLGFISSFGGLIMVICAFKGYEMLGGRLDKAGVVTGCIISVLMLLAAEQFSLSLQIYNSYKEYYDITFFDAFQSVPSFLQESEIMSFVVKDIAIGYLLMAAGAWSTIRHAYKQDEVTTRMQTITTVRQD